MYRMDPCVFWYASSDLLGLSWKCQAEKYSLQQPDKVSLEDVIGVIALSLSRFLGNFIQGFMVPPEDTSFGGEKRLHVAWNGGAGALRAAVPFPLEDRHTVPSLPIVRWVWWPEKQSMKMCLWISFGVLLQKEVEWAVRPKEQLSKGSGHSAPSWDNSDIFTVVQVSPLSAYPELHHLVQYGPKVWQNQNLFPYLRSEPGAFNHGKQRLTAQSTDFKEAGKLLMKKSVYSAWIMGSGIWLLLIQAWLLCRCYSVRYYSKV